MFKAPSIITACSLAVAQDAIPITEATNLPDVRVPTEIYGQNETDDVQPDRQAKTQRLKDEKSQRRKDAETKRHKDARTQQRSRYQGRMLVPTSEKKN